MRVEVGMLCVKLEIIFTAKKKIGFDVSSFTMYSILIRCFFEKRKKWCFTVLSLYFIIQCYTYTYKFVFCFHTFLSRYKIQY